MVAVIDYDCGNTASVINMIRRAGGEAVLTRDANVIMNADKIILPGVGSFDYGISKLLEFHLFDVIKEFGFTQKPILGICLGMQLLGKSSEEGILGGLGLIDANFIKFSKNEKSIKIPHVGWNGVNIIREEGIFENFVNDDTRFYFVHSYYAICNDIDNIIGLTDHGQEFVSAYSNNSNIFGVQFHPEKSHKYGLKLINNFLNIK